jgi:hypothetical protein
MNLETIDINGAVAERKNVALAAFGKAFLLPFDVVLGWIFTNERRQRIFNRASNTTTTRHMKKIKLLIGSGRPRSPGVHRRGLLYPLSHSL